MKTGHAYLLSAIERDEDTMLFWLVTLAWKVLGVWLIAADFYPPLSI